MNPKAFFINTYIEKQRKSPSEIFSTEDFFFQPFFMET